MPDYPYKMKKGGVTALETSAVDRVLSIGDGDAALLYLSLLRQEDGPALLDFDPPRMERAAALLRQAGLLEDKGALSSPPDTPPAVLRESRETSPGLQALCACYEKAAGRPLKPAELSALHDACTRLGLPAPVLMTLITCLSREKRPLSAARFEKESCFWADKKIDTLEKAETFLKEAEERRGDKRLTARLLHIDGRELSPTEDKYIEGWLAAGFPPEVIERAYDKTIVNTGALKWRYLDKILANWQAQGIRSVREIEEKDAPAPAAKPASAADSAFSVEYAKKVKEYLKKEGGGGDVL